MKNAIGIAIFAALLATAATAIIAQAKYDIARTVLLPVEETGDVLTPVAPPAALIPAE